MFAPDCFLIHQQKICLSTPLTYAGDKEMLLSSRKPNDPVWHSELSSFPVLRPSYPACGRHIRQVRLQRSSLRGQNPNRS
jgi:hypothetical protein